MRAFEVDAVPIGIKSIVFHSSAGKARYSTFLAARDAGFNVSLIELLVRRRPDFDQSLVRGSKIPTEGKCYARESFATIGDF